MAESTRRKLSVESREQYGAPEAILVVLHDLRAALAELLITVGADPKKARATARFLELDTNSVWRITHLINATDILSAMREIPSRNKIEKLCAVCAKRGAPSGTVNKVLAAIDTFERAVEYSVGDRESFDALLTGLDYDDVTQRQESSRKLTFLGNSSLWGVQAKVNFKAVIFALNEDDSNYVSAVRVSGLVNLRRLRPVRWPLYHMYLYRDDGTTITNTPDPIDPYADEVGGLPLLESFSSTDNPDIVGVETEYGKSFILAPGPIGNAGAKTFVFADRIAPMGSRFRNGVEEYAAAMIDLVTPSELLVFDMFVHQDLNLSTPPEALLLDRLSTVRGYNPPEDEQHKLPLSIKPLLMGRGSASSATPQFPQYPEVLEYVFERAGWVAREFVGYRLVLRYPPVPTAAVMRMPLPERHPESKD